MFYASVQLLDFLLGHGHVALFRRAELKTLVDMHGNEVCITALHYSKLQIKSISFGHWLVHIFMLPDNLVELFNMLVILIMPSDMWRILVLYSVKAFLELILCDYLVMFTEILSLILPSPSYLYCWFYNPVIGWY